jgi:branched-chain amino acid transport system ATP-binding protein
MERYSQEMSQDSLLEISNVDAFYGTFQALWDVSLVVKPGEILALIGSNASGKSTLINTISGVIHPARGTIEFGGRDISTLDPFQIVTLGISQVPEGRRIFPEMTVLDNLILGSYNRQARPSREQNLKRVYEHFPILEERRRQLAKTLSGGEQQMLAIGRGLMSAPKLMLFDEISLGLAPKVTDELYKAVREIRAKGITILLVEQNVRRSVKEADRAYIMKAGRIVLGKNAAECQEEEIRQAYFGVCGQ